MPDRLSKPFITVFVLGSLLPCAITRGGDCAPIWSDQFAAPLTEHSTLSSCAVYEEPNGRALFISGEFIESLGEHLQSVVRWDGVKYSNVGGGIVGTAGGMTVFDDGTGPALYVSVKQQSVTNPCGSPSVLQKWDGHNWSQVGGAFCGGMYGDSWLGRPAVFDDGNGIALYVGGDFTIADGWPAQGFAKWDGSAWVEAGGGVTGIIYRMESGMLSGDRSLFVTGEFSLDDGATYTNFARWDGQTWTDVGQQMQLPGWGYVADILIEEDEVSPSMYVAGQFVGGGQSPFTNIAHWDGKTWARVGAMPFEPEGYIASLRLERDAQGKKILTAAGSFPPPAGSASRTGDDSPPPNLAQWDGNNWTIVGFGEGITSLSEFNDGRGPSLVGLPFLSTPLRWNGESWGGLGGGIDNRIRDFEPASVDGREYLFASGDFQRVSGQSLRCVARWNGSDWSSAGQTIVSSIRSLQIFDDGQGDGPSLFAAGNLYAPATEARQVARLAGLRWLPVGFSGPIYELFDMEVFDDGSSPALYVCGDTYAGVGVHKWDGSAWSPVGSGFDRFFDSLAVFDDGTGAALFAGGSFTAAGPLPVAGIARWDGAKWTPLGSGVAGTVYAMQVFHDGTGPALFVAGDFNRAGDTDAVSIAKWDGSRWSELGSGLKQTNGRGVATTLTVFDDGSGAALYVGGTFEMAGGIPVNGLARWNGTEWASVAQVRSGIGGTISALEVWDDGDGPALFISGGFEEIDGVQSHHVARYGCPRAPKITFQPRPVAGGLGRSARFDVGVTSIPHASFQWRRNGVPLTRSAHIEGATSPTLIIHDVRESDVGRYDCVVSNMAGQSASRAARLSIQLIAKSSVTP
jgi:hypothetical protein